jgi:hypothetical protein
MTYSKEQIEYAKLNKCVTSNCYNFREPGYPKCNTCLRGDPKPIPEDMVKILKEEALSKIKVSRVVSDVSLNCRDCLEEIINCDICYQHFEDDDEIMCNIEKEEHYHDKCFKKVYLHAN